MRLVLRGTYGPVIPGSAMEQMALQGLRDEQHEEIMRTRLLVYAGYEVKQEELKKAYKEYTAAASPHAHAEIKRRDAKRIKELEEEVARGAFTITPLYDPTQDAIVVRGEERAPRRLRMRKKKNRR